MRTYLGAILGVFLSTATAWGSDKSDPTQDTSSARVRKPNPDETISPSDSSSARTIKPSSDDTQRLGACVEAAKLTGSTVSPSGKVTFYKRPQIIEAESLLDAGKVQVNGGQLGVQPMAGFGPGWGGDAQLFWSGGGVGAVLDATITALKKGTYKIHLHMTKAPDFGQVKTQVKGLHPVWISGKQMDSWSPSVEPPYGGFGELVTGNVQLARGDNHLSLMITGKNDASSGYLIGIDCIVLQQR